MPAKIDAAEVRRIFPEVDQITDAKLRQGVIDIWIEVAAEMAWDKLEDIPKNLDVEKYRRLVDHIRGVTRMALALADVAQREHGTKVDRDMLIAVGLLHDVSKPVECEPDPEGKPTGGPAKAARKSEMGAKIQHAVYATHKVFAHGLPLELAHLVVTHTHASNVRPTKSIEAALLFYADYADSDVGIIPKGGKPFVARWEVH
ncbi:MAG: HD domain-containing protein [Alphaproteobacteria bacterium]|nr:HD domain-containing protein [Alphaproteobacteria bacterium]